MFKNLTGIWKLKEKCTLRRIILTKLSKSREPIEKIFTLVQIQNLGAWLTEMKIDSYSLSLRMTSASNAAMKGSQDSFWPLKTQKAWSISKEITCALSAPEVPNWSLSLTELVKRRFTISFKISLSQSRMT